MIGYNNTKQLRRRFDKAQKSTAQTIQNQQATFYELLSLYEQSTLVSYQLYNRARSLEANLQTYNHTMAELDQVFT